MKPRVAVLISGRGSNMAALIVAASQPAFPADIAMVIADRDDAPGIDRAGALGVPASVIAADRFGRDRAAHEAAIDRALEASEIDLVCLAGWMRVFTGFLVERWAGRMLNIHPSLLPAFPGLHTHARALAAGVRLHGCTVHVVTEALDDGPILAQAAVPVLPGDDTDRLAARVLAQEHRIYPAALRHFVGGPAPASASSEVALLNPLPETASAP